jgi:hypothetical protein
LQQPTRETEDIERLAVSVSALIDTLVQLFPEGEGEAIDEDQYLTILSKAQQDATKLKAILSGTP